MTEKTVLLGMVNPLSRRPELALWPSPVNCTGWRVWQMLAVEGLTREPPEVVTAEDYAAAFDRRNVLTGRTWDSKAAGVAARDLLDVLTGRRLIVLGVSTLRACGLPRRPWGEWSEYHWLAAPPIAYCLLPHPSGLCREYNDPEIRTLAGRTLLEEMRRGQAARIEVGDPPD